MSIVGERRAVLGEGVRECERELVRVVTVASAGADSSDDELSDVEPYC